ncbi:MAG: DUF4097 family beta strand repeat-containing protein [Tenuifilaceae bacterium]|nr:DUF4097 family beta strand repeat-containing protein [Tenuifilaceae bacterium]
MKSNRLYVILAMVVLVGLSVPTKTLFGKELSKSYSQEFSIEKGAELYISNRFGQVVVENWDKNSIAIDVVVKVEHPSADRAERMLSAINVTLEQVGTQVRGTTEIDERLMRSVSNFNFGTSTKELSIDYTIRMPKHVDADLRNKYGDMFIDELTGLSKIDVKYGNLKANRIVYGSNDPLSQVTLGYGNASIDEVSWMRLDVKYANLDIVKGQALVVLSKYSKISIEELSSLVLESKYDSYTIGNVANLVGESGYTNYRIKNLSKKLNVKSRYGDVRIETVSPGFENISFEGSYGSIYAPIPESVSYSIDGEASYGSVSHHSPARVSRIESNNRLSVNGRVGNNENTNKSVKVKVRYGSARLK